MSEPRIDSPLQRARHLKAQQAPPAPPAAAAAPVNGTPAATPAQPHSEALLARYTQRAVGAELDRLDALPRPWQPHSSYWDATTFEVACNLIELANSDWSGYTLDNAHHDLLTHAPTDHAWAATQHEKCWRSAQDRIGGAGREHPDPLVAPATVVPEPATALDPATEAAFWAARTTLTHLHDYARARRVSPWAVLGVALARAATATPFDLGLPPIVGAPASLNLFVGLVGASGSGKGAAEGVATEALHVGPITSHNVGSGEGIGHGYMRRTKGALEWLDEDHAVLFSVPEIDAFAALGDRKGATLLPQLRSAWSGEQLGFGYADPTKRILIPAHAYRLCLVAGIQPGRSRALLDDTDGGTPQRFLWLPADDPDAPDTPPVCPRPRHWQPPSLSGLRGVGGRHLDVCAHACQTIAAARLARLRGDGDALDGHSLLTQLKTAAILALLEGRLRVEDEDWALAETIMAKSAATRERCRRALTAQSRAVNEARAHGEAERVVVVSERVADEAVKRICGRVVRKLRRTADWTPRRALTRAAGRDVQHLEEALERLLDTGQLEATDVEYRGQRGARYRLKEES